MKQKTYKQLKEASGQILGGLFTDSSKNALRAYFAKLSNTNQSNLPQALTEVERALNMYGFTLGLNPGDIDSGQSLTKGDEDFFVYEYSTGDVVKNGFLSVEWSTGDNAAINRSYSQGNYGKATPLIFKCILNDAEINDMLNLTSVDPEDQELQDDIPEPSRGV